MTDINYLLATTSCAVIIGLALAEVFRVVFQVLFKRLQISEYGKTSGMLKRFYEFVQAAISSFILIACSYEKSLLLWAGFRGLFYLFTFFLLLVYFRIFSIFSPSPCSTLEKHWSQIRRSGNSAVVVKDGILKQTSWSLESLWKMTMTYCRLEMSSLFGQCLGLLLAIRWLKFYWDGWLTAHHETNLPVLDECLPCLNTHVLMGFIIESAITFTFLISFDLIDQWFSPQDGADKSLGVTITQNSVKGGLIITAMYFFMDVTGSFANPFLAISLQRHCLTDLRTTLNLFLVYCVGPFLSTIVYLWLRQSDDKKVKQSV